MNNVIATWMYCDAQNEETLFPQSGLKSSSFEHQAVYWRCVLVFYAFAQKYNPDNTYCFYTNKIIPELTVDNINIFSYLKERNVSIFELPFTYKPPHGYYHSFGNQLYVFDIFKSFISNFSSQDNLLLLDSDCIITQKLDSLFDILKTDAAVTFLGEYRECNPENNKINGITRNEMTQLFSELLNEKIQNPVNYLCGEFFCARYKFMEKMMSDFPFVYQNMIDKFICTKDSSLPKFNEEAHFLSFFYYKYNIPIGKADSYIKRMWNTQNYYTIEQKDIYMPIWHVLSGKCRYPEIIEKQNKILKKKQDKILKVLKKIFLDRPKKQSVLMKIHIKIRQRLKHK